MQKERWWHSENGSHKSRLFPLIFSLFSSLVFLPSINHACPVGLSIGLLPGSDQRGEVILSSALSSPRVGNQIYLFSKMRTLTFPPAKTF